MEYSAQGELVMPPNRQLRIMDADLLARAMWRDLTLQAYGSIGNFLAKGMGVCVMDAFPIYRKYVPMTRFSAQRGHYDIVCVGLPGVFANASGR